MTELDLQALGIWWIPVSSRGRSSPDTVNVWAIENRDHGMTLFDCGLDSASSLTAISNGLADAGATLRDVRRVIVSHAHAEHSGGLGRLLSSAGERVEVFASRVEGQRVDRVPAFHEIKHGDRLEFRCFGAVALLSPGHSPGLICLHSERRDVLFTSDHLCHDLGSRDAVAWFGTEDSNLDAYARSLARLQALDVSVVLPGRGQPFAGHRRVIREIRSRFGHRRDGGPPAFVAPQRPFEVA
jgi:glyoxylase-like metal-dependent hydrolase (beta-lactamase superfamily II)